MKEMEMLMLLAATMSKESVIERIVESSDEYKEAKLLNNLEAIEKAEKELFVAANLYLMHEASKGDIKKAMQNIREMEEIEKAHKFFQTPKN